jgi:hypothetical protein
MKLRCSKNARHGCVRGSRTPTPQVTSPGLKPATLQIPMRAVRAWLDRLHCIEHGGAELAPLHVIDIEDERRAVNRQAR